MSQCPRCGKQCRETDHFCRNCGKALGTRCVCGASCMADDRFCWQCGQSLGADSQTRMPGNEVTGDSAPAPARDILQEAEEDSRHSRLGRKTLDQSDVDKLFDEDE